MPVAGKKQPKAEIDVTSDLAGDKPITTAAVLSPNQWEFLQRERFRRGHGWNISRLIREAIEAHYGSEASDEVAKPGGYLRGEK